MFKIHYSLAQIFLSSPIFYNPLTSELFRYLRFKTLSANEILGKISTSLTDKNSTVWVETGLGGPAVVHHSGLPFSSSGGTEALLQKHHEELTTTKLTREHENLN